MKKSLLVLAVLGAFAGVASAQSNVTIYGSFDGGLRNFSNVDAAGNSKLTMGSNGTYNSNRLGFKGVEDLGGGMNAHFTLESGFNTGTGTLDNAATLFNRSAFVGLGGAWGTIDLGRQYTVAFKTIAAYGPMQYKYTAIVAEVPATAGTRYNNDIQYSNAVTKELTVRAEYALGEVAGATNTGSAKSVGATYLAGPLSLGAAYTMRSPTATLDNKHYTLGGAYAFAPVKVFVGYTDEKADVTTTTQLETKYTWIGASYDFSPVMQATYAYYETKTDGTAIGKKKMNIIAGTYALSKRTNFYADLDFTKLTGAQILNGQDNNNGVSVGINHFF